MIKTIAALKGATVLKFAPVLVAAIAGGALAVSSAVGLGVSANNSLGAGVSVTSVCQPTTGTPIAVGFSAPTFSSSTGKYTVNTVNLTNVAAACAGQNIKVTVADSSNNTLASYTGTVAGTSVSAALGSAIDSALVANVAVVIYS